MKPVADLKVGDRLPARDRPEGYIEVSTIEVRPNGSGRPASYISWAHDEPNAAPTIWNHRMVIHEDGGGYRLVPRRLVRDNAALAWRNCTQVPLHQLPGDFVFEYRELLDGAAITAMEMALPDAWSHTGTGFEVRLVPEDEVRDPYGVTDEVRWCAWDRAAQSIDPDALVAAAGLEAELHAHTD